MAVTVLAAVTPHVRPVDLLVRWDFGDAATDVALVVDLVALTWYAGAIRRLAHRGRSRRLARTAAFTLGITCVFVAVVSPLASYDDTVFTLHVVQHILLMMVAPPLLALGAPVTLAIQAAKRPLQVRIVRTLHHPIVRRLTPPLVLAAVYYASMYAAFLTPIFPYTVDHPLAHDAEHVVLFAIGCAFWWPMVALDELPRRPPFPARILLLFLGMPLEVILGISLTGMSAPISSAFTLADTHTGGSLWWVTSTLLSAAAALIVLTQWMRHEQRESWREDRRLDAIERAAAADASTVEPGR